LKQTKSKVRDLEQCDRMHAKVSDKSIYFFLTFILIASAYWIWLGCEHRSMTEDEGISFLSAKAILDHGYPLLPSGYIYHRGYLPHYLLAAGISCLGTNEFSLMLPSLLFSLGTLFILFLSSREITGSGWLGAAAALLLVSLQIQAFYSTGPRMYSGLQFFSLLAVYCFFRGFLKTSSRYQILAVYAVIGAVLCHRQGAVFLFVLPVSFFILYMIPSSKKIKVKFNPGLIAAFLFLTVVLFFIYIYEPASSLPVISMGGGEKAEEVHIGINLFRSADHVFKLEHALPLGLIWIPLGFVSALRSLKEQKPGYFYIFLVLLLSIFSTTLMLQTPQPRFWYFILPVYSLAVCIGIFYGIKTLLGPSRLPHQNASERKKKNTPSIKSKKIQTSVLISFGLLISFFLYLGASLHKNEIPLLDNLKKGYGIPCKNPMCHKDIKKFYAVLKSLIQPDDEVVSTNPWVTYYYLNQVNGFLRENRTSEDKFSAYISPEDEYFGIKLIDTQTELIEINNSPKSIWVITYYKFPIFSSPETRSFIEKNFFKVVDYNFIKAYLNFPK